MDDPFPHRPAVEVVPRWRYCPGREDLAVKCKACGAQLDFTQSTCPACGLEVELGRLTGILGIVCRRCDAYNEPGSKVCEGCGEPLGETKADAIPEKVSPDPVRLPSPPLPSEQLSKVLTTAEPEASPPSAAFAAAEGTSPRRTPFSLLRGWLLPRSQPPVSP